MCQNIPASNGLTPSADDHQVLASIHWHKHWCASTQLSFSVEIEIIFCYNCIMYILWRYPLLLGCCRIDSEHITLKVCCRLHSYAVRMRFHKCHRFGDNIHQDSQRIVQRDIVTCRTSGCAIPMTILEFLKWPVIATRWYLQRCVPR